MHPKFAMKKTIFGKLLVLSFIVGGLASFATGSGRTVLAQSWGINGTNTSELTETPASPADSATPEISTPEREAAPLIADINEFQQYGQVIERTKSMLRDPEAQHLAA